MRTHRTERGRSRRSVRSRTVSRRTPRSRKCVVHGSRPVAAWTPFVPGRSSRVDPVALRPLARDGAEPDASAGGQRCSDGPAGCAGSGAPTAAGSRDDALLRNPSSSRRDLDRSDGRCARDRGSARRERPGGCPRRCPRATGDWCAHGSGAILPPPRRRLTPSSRGLGKPGRFATPWKPGFRLYGGRWPGPVVDPGPARPSDIPDPGGEHLGSRCREPEPPATQPVRNQNYAGFSSNRRIRAGFGRRRHGLVAEHELDVIVMPPVEEPGLAEVRVASQRHASKASASHQVHRLVEPSSSALV